MVSIHERTKPNATLSWPQLECYDKDRLYLHDDVIEYIYRVTGPL